MKKYCEYCGEKVRRIGKWKRNLNFCSGSCTRKKWVSIESEIKKLITSKKKLFGELK